MKFLLRYHYHCGNYSLTLRLLNYEANLAIAFNAAAKGSEREYISNVACQHHIENPLLDPEIRFRSIIQHQPRVFLPSSASH